MITTKILLHSANPDGAELITCVSTYPRFIHSEFMTHRAFSRNAASSRAVPLEKMILDVQERGDSVVEFWGANQSGMQASAELLAEDRLEAIDHWAHSRRRMVNEVLCLKDLNVHKQIANRLLEPFAHITVIHTSSGTGLMNFFKLRAHPAAQPEFQVLAYRMLKAYVESVARPLDWGEWHIPMDEQTPEFSLPDRRKIATGRIARVSYLTHDGVRDPQKDIELHDRLAEAGHWSPFEHCAEAIANRPSSDNFGRGWRQYRKHFEKEACGYISPRDLAAMLINRPEWVKL